MKITGIHHITAIAGPAAANYDFYTRVLGLRMVKKTVNFDDPHTWHLYYGDENGNPGTLLTFFSYAGARQGRTGSGMAHRIAMSVPEESFAFWADRIATMVPDSEPSSTRFGTPVLTFRDPDGILLEITVETGLDHLPGWTATGIPREHRIRAFAGTTLLIPDTGPSVVLLERMGYRHEMSDGRFDRFSIPLINSPESSEAPELSGPADNIEKADNSKPAGTTGPDDTSGLADTTTQLPVNLARHIDLESDLSGYGLSGKGTIHHIAFRARNEEEQQQWREVFLEAGLQPTEVIDRKYFKSIYFREPGGVLYELATDFPGMMVDESQAELGKVLQLPPWYENRREQIEKELPSLDATNTHSKS